MECVLCLGVRELQSTKNDTGDEPFGEYLLICKKYLTVEIMESEFDRNREFHSSICTVCFCSVEALYEIHTQLKEIQEKLIEYSISFSEILKNRREGSISTIETLAIQSNEQIMINDFESLDGGNDDTDLEGDSQTPPVSIDSSPPIKKSIATHRFVPAINTKGNRKNNQISNLLVDSETNNKSSSESDSISDAVSDAEDDDTNVLFGCWKCSKKCKTREEFDVHSRSHLPPQVDFCVCSLCGNKLSSKTQLEKHILTVHKYDDNTFKCEICGKMYKTETLLKHHQSGHTTERMHKCDVCGKSYFWPSNLKVHKYKAHGIGRPIKPQIKSKSKPKTYCCDECGKIFNAKQSFDDHMRIHTGEKPFRCDEKDCEMAFRTSFNLKTHKLKSHITYAPFVCPIKLCTKKFQFRSELMNHRASAHTTDNDKVNCNECGKEYKNNWFLRSHVKFVHEKESWPHVCHICGKRFSTPLKLANHVRTHTGEKPFECTECNKHFTSKARLYQHRKEKSH